MRSTIFLLVTSLAAYTVAIPSKVNPTRAIRKRAAPSIGSGFEAQQTTQLTDAFDDALELARYVTSDFQDAVFTKYFNASDKGLVKNVFLNILGGDPSGKGSDLLSSITITPKYLGFWDDGECANNDTEAKIYDWPANEPYIVVCNPGGFGNGGITKGYGTVKAVICEDLGPRVSDNMKTLGTILLHEYTHWRKLVAPPLSKATVDYAYGPDALRRLPKENATLNADSYSWFATENFWTAICQTDYQDPLPSDDDDDDSEQGWEGPESP
ncbi:MAG: hypothetical protein Q9165_002017 [Trypethelium subeluteriae]